MKKEFTIELGSQATITASGETGKVIGRAEYEHSENAYFVRYKAADGRAVEAWWSESSLSAAQ